MCVEVRFRTGHSYRGIEAVAAEQSLSAIAQPDGTLAAEEVVESARAENSPLHPVFDWNDAHAAQEHRLAQARKLIRAVQVRVIIADDDARWVPKYHNVRITRDEGTSERRYTDLAVVRQSPPLIEQVRQRILDDLLAARREWESFAHIEEFRDYFAPVFAAVDRLELAATA